MNFRLEQQIVNALVLAMNTNRLSDTSYRTFRNYLNNTKQYAIKCMLLDNKYLYNSIVEKANSIRSQNSLL